MVETELTAESAAKSEANEADADPDAKNELNDAVNEVAIDFRVLELWAEALVSTLMLEPIRFPATYKSP